ncbi:MAG: hypothetical protein ACE369_01225 [Roseovarius sp.]
MRFPVNRIEVTDHRCGHHAGPVRRSGPAICGDNVVTHGKGAGQVGFGGLTAADQGHGVRMANNQGVFPLLTTILETRHILASK